MELLPLAAFPGQRGWGYDGVLPFAVHPAYGRPEDLRAFADAAHALGLMVLLDVVYNHFGPEGNYLHAHCPAFFNPAHQTPWGAAINFDGAQSQQVRDFFVHNALYWVEEFRFDGLRLDAVHAIRDDSPRHIVADICAALDDLPLQSGRPTAIVAHTVKAKGIAEIQGAVGSHYWKPKAVQLTAAIEHAEEAVRRAERQVRA